MPEIEIKIGGRSFEVACQAGEEHFLHSAAAALDAEAQPLMAAMGRLPESRMLLMAGLMLADRTAALEEETRQLRAELDALRNQPAPEAERIEVEVVPPELSAGLAHMAEQAEALAAEIETRLRA